MTRKKAWTIKTIYLIVGVICILLLQNRYLLVGLLFGQWILDVLVDGYAKDYEQKQKQNK